MKPEIPLSQVPDAELDARIERFGERMLAADARFKQSGDIADRSERDRWWVAKRMHLIERARRNRIHRALQEDSEITRLKEENAALRRRLMRDKEVR